MELIPMQKPGELSSGDFGEWSSGDFGEWSSEDFGESGVDQYAKPLTIVQPVELVQPSLDLDGLDRNSSVILHDEAPDDDVPQE